MGIVLWVVLGCLCTLVLGLCTVVYQLIRQQGLLLLRIEEVEQRLPPADQIPLVPTPAANSERRTRGCARGVR